MSDLCLTWVSNCNDSNFNEYLVFFKSLREKQSRFIGDTVVLTNSLEDHYRQQLRSLGCLIYDVNQFQPPPKIDWVVRDRFFAFWQYLSQREYEYVLISDARDVLIQESPFVFMRGRLWRHSVALTSEGFPHRVSPFNMVDQLDTQRNVRDFDQKYMDWPVVNAGVMIGRSEALRNLCFLIWTNTVRSMAGTDQAALNYLYSYLRMDKAYFLADPHHCPLAVTGEALRHRLLNIEPIHHEDQICMPDGRPYFIFHQWDRTEFRDQILQRYSG